MSTGHFGSSNSGLFPIWIQVDYIILYIYIYISICIYPIISYHQKMLSLYPHSFPPQQPRFKWGPPSPKPRWSASWVGSPKEFDQDRDGVCAFLFSHYNLHIPWLDVNGYVYIYIRYTYIIIYTRNYMLYICIYIYVRI